MPYADPERQRAYFKARKERMKAAGTWVEPKHRPGQRLAYYHAHRDAEIAKRRERDARNIEKRREERNRWARKNPEKIKAQKKRLRERQGAVLRAKMREYLQQKPDGSDLTRCQIYKRRQRERHREKLNERQRLHGLTPSRRIEIRQKMTICGDLCYICGLHLNLSEMEVDHVYPVVKGGTSHIHNLMPVHRVCNRKKSKRLNHPIARPDLVELAKCVEELPRGKRRCKGDIQAMKIGTKPNA